MQKLLCEFRFQPSVNEKLDRASNRSIDNGLIDVFVWKLQDNLFSHYTDDDEIDYCYVRRTLTYLEFCLHLAFLSDRDLTPDFIEIFSD